MLYLKHIEDTGQLPTSTYHLYDDKKKVGLLQIRHKTSVSSEFPKDMGSHIYYEIFESEQGKGYGTKILHLAKEEALRLGMKELFISVEESNPASIKIIEKNGGILVKSAFLEKNKEHFFLYRIELLK